MFLGFVYECVEIIPRSRQITSENYLSEHNNMSHLYVCGLVLEKYVQNQSAENSAKLKTSSVSRDCWEAHGQFEWPIKSWMFVYK